MKFEESRGAALAGDYDTFYGADAEAPVSDVTALGAEIAAETMAGSPDAVRVYLELDD